MQEQILKLYKSYGIIKVCYKRGNQKSKKWVHRKPHVHLDDHELCYVEREVGVNLFILYLYYSSAT